MIERRYADVRLAVATAARDLFLENHSTSVTVEAIAQRAGVSVRTFYRHFAAKEDVVAPLFERSAASLAERFDASPGGDGDVLPELVHALTAELAAGAHEWRGLLQVLMATPEYRLRWENTEDNLVDSLTDFLSRWSIHRDDTFVRKVTAQLVLTASRAAYLEWLFGGSEAEVDELQALHLRALSTIADGWRPRPL
ncbi:hypothetical protein BKE56_000950 [Rhodococcus sp. M8]|nr:hypothetical protein BKE56_000950 [Rhodococcus sp. M8]